MSMKTSIHQVTFIKQQQLFIGDYLDKPAPKLSDTLTQYITIIDLKFCTRIPNLPSHAFQSTPTV